MADQQDLDDRIQAYYGGAFDEHARLRSRSAQGRLEHRRVQELVCDRVAAGARILDIGGGTGAHAITLQGRGYAVSLIDPVAQHVSVAGEAGLDAQVGDARDLPFEDASFAATLMLGPLYHLRAASDRRRAIEEARRVTDSGGWIFAGAISRYVAFGQIFLTRDPAEADVEEWVALLRDGAPSRRLRFPAGHFHTAESLERELLEAGVVDVHVHGVEGPAGVFMEQLPVDVDPELQSAAARLADAASEHAGVRDMSAHLLAIGRVP
ncbi:MULTISPECIES: class I SAM-dependent methyltransferase [unclassified Microbacterium]|uniref:class I SAM-dependent methyltransferase n=1 Tax=unclassified Microbacterium TaxID=2609290 RepID=UPI001DD3DBA5|nr:class I SAM-dependent methyltransferase [Microbacterium sp. Bi121]CAH0178357.1 Demethylrebeccamycin-D-glucose O-methyltransferase [Microbacterium sp. Bi121]